MEKSMNSSLVEVKVDNEEFQEWSRIRNTIDIAVNMLSDGNVRAKIFRSRIKEKYGIEGIPYIKTDLVLSEI